MACGVPDSCQVETVIILEDGRPVSDGARGPASGRLLELFVATDCFAASFAVSVFVASGFVIEAWAS